MGDPISAALTIGASGMKIAGNIGDGIQKKTAGQIDAMRLQMAAEAGKVRALQTDAAYRDDLNQSLGAIAAIRTAQNVSIDSPTGMVLNKEAERRSDIARSHAVSNERMRALGLEADSAILLKSSRQWTRAALINSIPEALSIGQSIGKAF